MSKQINPRWVRCVALTLILALLVIPRATYAQTSTAPTPFVVEEVDAMALRNGSVFWVTYRGCAGGEVPVRCKVRAKPTGGGNERMPYHNPSATTSIVNDSLAVDETYLYWSEYNGAIKRLSHNATTPATLEQVATRQVPNAAITQVAVDQSYLYWVELDDHVGTANDKGYLFRQHKSSGAAQEMERFDAPITQLKADGARGVYYISSRFLLHTYESTSPGLFTTDGVPGGSVQSYTFDSDTLYWVDHINGLRIKKARRDNLNAGTVVHSPSSSGNPTVPALAVDGTNLYWQEARAGRGPIFRMPKIGGARPDPISDDTVFNVNGLTEERGQLFWFDSGGIFTLPTDAAPVRYDLQALDMEIFQAIQGGNLRDASTNVPLVQGKETFVRLYGRFWSNTGSTSRHLSPQPRLQGRDGSGTPLPGSPLWPINGATTRLLTSDPDRTNPAEGYLFRLPPSWSNQPTIDLDGILPPSPNPSLRELSTDNNVFTLRRTLTAKVPICLDLVPVQLAHSVAIAVFDPLNPQTAVFNRAATLLPTSVVQTCFRGGPRLLKPVGFELLPFTLSRQEPDAHWLIFWMNMRYLFADTPSACRAANATTTRVAMVEEFPNREVDGMAGGGSLLFFNLSRNPGGVINRPGGGVALAHELGHLYGRNRVACPPNGPEWLDGNYRYPICELDFRGPMQHIGFDPVSQTFIQPNAAADLMSHGHDNTPPLPRWPSDYTWKGIFNALRNRDSVTAATVNGRSASHALLISGVISGTSVLFEPAYQPDDSLFATLTRNLSGRTQPSPDYAVNLYDAGNNLLHSTPLTVLDLSHSEAAATMTAFTTLIEYSGGAARIDVAKNSGAVLGSLTAGANPPSVSISSPVAGSTISDTLAIAWAGSDPDADPLRYVVRYSTDNGATWIALDSQGTANHLTVDMRNGMPGGSQALVQVLASDGIHTAIATSEPFSVDRHAPQATIVSEQFTTLDAAMSVSTAFAQPVILHGRGYDAEDGSLSEGALQWQLVGPTILYGEGEQLTLFEVPPGDYAVTLTATDSDHQAARATTTLHVAPKYVAEGATPTLDGLCDDEGYERDATPLPLRYADGALGEVRLIHADNALFACFNGLPIGLETPGDFVGLRIDPNQSGDALALADDLGFFVGSNGLVSTATGDGVGGFTLDALPQQFNAVVSRGDDAWSAELRIAEARLGGWQHTIGLKASHYWRTDVGDDTVWPPESTWNSPTTWSDVVLGSNPTPTIHSLTPNPVTVGDADFMLTVAGAGFVPGSVVRWNGEDRPTSYISSAQVTARIAAVDRAEASTVLVSVMNPAPGGGESTPLPLTLQPGEKQSQAITFAPLSTKILGDPPFTLSALASSGLAVSFSSATPAVCTVSGSSVTLVALGVCTITATQPGNDRYHPAPASGQSFTVASLQPQPGAQHVYLPVVQR